MLTAVPYYDYQSCDGVQCPSLENCVGSIYTPADTCCPVCTVTLDCSHSICSEPYCNYDQKLVVPPGQCCGVCEQLSCNLVECGRLLDCDEIDQVIPVGECCPVCKLPTTPDCQLVECDRPQCDESEQVIPEGECCPKCPLVQDCRDAMCLPMHCFGDKELVYTKDSCCPVCKPTAFRNVW